MSATNTTSVSWTEGATRECFSLDLGAFAGPEDAYAAHVRGFMAYLLETDQTLSIEAIGDYFRHLNRSGYAASTIRVKRQAIKDRVRRVCARWPERYRRLAEMEIDALDRDPATKCPGKSSVRVDEYDLLTSEEFERLVAGCRSARQRAFAQFLYATGARVSEMCSVRLTDCIAFGPGYVRIRLKGKGSRRRAFRERDVYLARDLFAEIQGAFNGQTYLFETQTGRPYCRTYVTNQLRRVTQAVLGRPVSAHKFRHSFATRMIRETGRVDATSRYLGHSDIRITLSIYSHDQFRPEEVLGQTGRVAQCGGRLPANPKKDHPPPALVPDGDHIRIRRRDNERV